jgi:hypothetical protein
MVPFVSPLSELTPNEKRIWNLLRTSCRGMTEKEIHDRIPDINTVGNRLRGLRQKGWVKNWKPSGDSPQLWYSRSVKD